MNISATDSVVLENQVSTGVCTILNGQDPMLRSFGAELSEEGVNRSAVWLYIVGFTTNHTVNRLEAVYGSSYFE